MATVILVLVVGTSVGLCLYGERAQRARPETPGPSAEPIEYLYARLRALGELKSRGAISQKEYSLRAKEMLGV